MDLTEPAPEPDPTPAPEPEPAAAQDPETAAPGETAAPSEAPSPESPIRALGAALTARVAAVSWEGLVSFLVVASAAVFVFVTVHPRLIFVENTPTGGDMGSHVWGPMYLMREVLPQWRLSGWSPDWYAGFPAYQFYMVVPMLAIVALHVGLRSPLLVLALPIALTLGASGWLVPSLHRVRRPLAVLGLALSVLLVPVPYGVAFKLVAVSGLVTLPIAAWALGRRAGAPFPVPPAMALGSLFFVYNLEPRLNSGTGNIIGGNLTSTMAGEFSFSIGLTLAVVYLGSLIHGLRTGRGRAQTAVLLALCGLCHIIPAFYALAATGLALVVWPGRARLRWFWPIGPVAGLLSAFWVLPFAGRHAYVNDMGWEPLPHVDGEEGIHVWEHIGGGARLVWVLAAALVGAGAVLVVHRVVRRSWVLALAPVAAILSVLVVRVALGSLSAVEAGLIAQPPKPAGSTDPVQDIWSYLTPGALRLPLAVAAFSLAVGIVVRQRLAYLLAGLVVVGAAGFVWVPDGRLWNARLLPLFYLSVFLLAAVGIGEVLRLVASLLSPDPDRPRPWVGVAVAAPATVAVIVFLGGPLGTLPGQTTTPEGAVEWLGITRAERNPGSSWARYNFRGLEGQLPVEAAAEGAEVGTGQGGWPEFRDLVATMDRLGQDPEHGCGRAFWEFGSDRLSSYGTTMAPMMLPYFTDGCIGSMEGLYFESSTTTPHHFLVQCQLSAKGSCSQRDLAYSGFDLDRGIQQLELLGVRYYMAFSDTAIQAADASDRLSLVAESTVWRIYEIDAEARALVVPLTNEPVVLEGVEPTQDSWLDPAAAWFMDPSRWDVPFTIDGPEEWARVELPEVPLTGDDGVERRVGDRSLPDLPRTPVPEVEVTDVRAGTDSLSFRVSEPGTPVLVKVSYFPNWEVEGAEGPYRVAPNLMVVVPTEREVVLRYGRTPLDLLGVLLSLVGVALVVVLWRSAPVPIPEGLLARRRRERIEAAATVRREAEVAAWLDAVPEADAPAIPEADGWDGLDTGPEPDAPTVEDRPPEGDPPP